MANVEGAKNTPQHEKEASQQSAHSAGAGTEIIENIEHLPRQLIAVSASKGPAAFFNLARKFLVTDEYCDLSALEGAIVAAVDAAHLLERSKLATIVRCVENDSFTVSNELAAHVFNLFWTTRLVISSFIWNLLLRKKRVTTSYVTVEPKRKKQHHGETESSHVASLPPSSEEQERRSSTRELRRARIVITVRRTESYKAWLDENPLQAVIAGDVGDDSDVAAVVGDLAET